MKIVNIPISLDSKPEPTIPLNTFGIADQCMPKGKIPLNGAGFITRHWSRSHPELYEDNKKVLERFGNFVGDTPVYNRKELDAWMGRRPILADKFTGFYKKDYPWENLQDGNHQFGEWWYAPLRKSVPFEEKLCACPSITNMVFNRFDRAVHSTNFYSLTNILENGSMCGPWEVKSNEVFSLTKQQD